MGEGCTQNIRVSPFSLIMAYFYLEIFCEVDSSNILNNLIVSPAGIIFDSYLFHSKHFKFSYLSASSENLFQSKIDLCTK